jgi:hypothetical protein
MELILITPSYSLLNHPPPSLPCYIYIYFFVVVVVLAGYFFVILLLLYSLVYFHVLAVPFVPFF